MTERRISLEITHFDNDYTVKLLNFQTPETVAVIYLKFKQRDQNLRVFRPNDAKWNRSNLIWFFTVCPDLSVQKPRVITVYLDN